MPKVNAFGGVAVNQHMSKAKQDAQKALIGFQVGGMKNVDNLLDDDPDNDDEAIAAKANPVNFLQGQLLKKNIQGKLNSGLNRKFHIKKLMKKQEKEENPYNFEKQRLMSPTSNQMLGSYLIKNADVQKMDWLYAQFKKRQSGQKPSGNQQSPFGSIDRRAKAANANDWSPLTTTDQNYQGNHLQSIKNGKVPQSRDGHTGIIHKGMLIIFGGDRHHMPFNDTHIFDILAELKSRELAIPQDLEGDAYHL